MLGSAPKGKYGNFIEQASVAAMSGWRCVLDNGVGVNGNKMDRLCQVRKRTVGWDLVDGCLLLLSSGAGSSRLV
jgi:hypothetical protein